MYENGVLAVVDVKSLVDVHIQAMEDSSTGRLALAQDSKKPCHVLTLHARLVAHPIDRASCASHASSRARDVEWPRHVPHVTWPCTSLVAYSNIQLTSFRLIFTPSICMTCHLDSTSTSSQKNLNLPLLAPNLQTITLNSHWCLAASLISHGCAWSHALTLRACLPKLAILNAYLSSPCLTFVMPVKYIKMPNKTFLG
ncbi:hypothetical protein E5676_scaffold313G003580 [Cucumis melo var. makuwa]|uniref:Uncharacterized protein n=1 Tax=Cucumis melo var. makuwa TaxID=1194695 RepID=A0A5D3DSE9_CUCMM|nr:hypothetical protein E6C27_scaffold154G00300 [Cucumis melo var. makuwa]TYK26697.1 hypothetical protein E5676_scaffold313G003580 [Cucumis melo var. makuwa]